MGNGMSIKLPIQEVQQSSSVARKSCTCCSRTSCQPSPFGACQVVAPGDRIYATAPLVSIQSELESAWLTEQ